ncbi:signal transduction histidine kinase [Saccharomonospora amisosensis]|uniref:histidine kinase n=1 Tax=Saccharomonospora amisosensis TaxID=1128677 RepID=A0A7X5ZNG9_9PSEU|nr:HAMP domain-containing sensor histidine kinase [Saccharomonospora amisosensis]NIJ09672.1 signal transduction histidine kinase [Saccharomonospora amisosensis]
MSYDEVGATGESPAAMRWWRAPRSRRYLVGLPDRADKLRPVGLITVWVRMGVVLSAAVLLLVGSGPFVHHTAAAWFVVCVAMAYSIVVLRHPSWEVEGRWPAAVITALDASLASGIVAFSGAAQSLAVSILFLVIVAAASRLSFLSTLGVSLLLGGSYVTIALVVDAGNVSVHDRFLSGMWWALYLLFTGALGSGLVLLNEHAERARGLAQAETIAARIVADEERDLRARLKAAYDAQETGLRVILHEFRTPVTSLGALVRDLSHEDDCGEARSVSTRRALLTAHVEHLSAMLNALADVAASRRPAFSTGHLRVVNVHEFILMAADAAGLPRERLRLIVSPSNAHAQLDAQLVRRVVTNLLENASRHGRDQPVSVIANLDQGSLSLEIADRGPGIPLDRAVELTAKFAQAGQERGTAGLGLWIVDQIIQALNGTIDFQEAAGGGLAVRVTLPVRTLAGRPPTQSPHP